MQTVMLKVSPATDEVKDISPVMVALSKELLERASYIYSTLELEEGCEPVVIKSDDCEVHWIDFLDEYVELSSKEASSTESLVDEEGYTCVEFPVERGLSVEKPQLLIDSDGVYLICEHDGQTYCSVVLNEELLEYLASEMEELVEEVV